MNTLFAIFNLGGGEIILILALVLILFGAKKLPELAKGLGTGIKEFKKATRDVTDEIHNSVNEPTYSTLPPPKRQVETPQAAPESTVAQTTEQPKPASVPPTDKKA
jgi:sec-independent protein translocase protein TatA